MSRPSIGLVAYGNSCSFASPVGAVPVRCWACSAASSITPTLSSREPAALGRLPDMTYVHQEPWPEPPLAADEATAIVAALERQRATLAWKCGGLDAEGLRATAAASSITLGGLLKHMALVE